MLKRKHYGLILVLVLLSQTACPKADQKRKLITAEDDAAQVISKIEKARTDLLNAGKINQATATKIDRGMLRVNRAVKGISREGDTYFASTASSPVGLRGAIEEFKAACDALIREVADGSLGVVNVDSKQLFTSFLNSLKSIASVVETVVVDVEAARKKG